LAAGFLLLPAELEAASSAVDPWPLSVVAVELGPIL
jgi:hypothetical protein